MGFSCFTRFFDVPGDTAVGTAGADGTKHPSAEWELLGAPLREPCSPMVRSWGTQSSQWQPPRALLSADLYCVWIYPEPGKATLCIHFI